MAIAITDAHRELADVARSFLEANKARAAARAPPRARPTRRSRRSGTSSRRSAGSGSTCPRSTADRGTASPSSSVVLEELGRGDRARARSCPRSWRRRVVDRAGTDAQQAAPASRARRRLAYRRARGLGGSLTLAATATLDGDAGLVLGGGLADLLLVPAGDDMVVRRRAPPTASTSTWPASLDPTRRVARVTLDRRDGRRRSRARRRAPALARPHAAARRRRSRRRRAATASTLPRAYAKDRAAVRSSDRMFQAVKHHCANMLVAAELATAAVWDAGRAADGDPDQFALACASAAALALPAFYRNAQLNIQVHGGIGFTWEHDGHLLLRRATTLAALFAADAAADAVARSALDGVTPRARIRRCPPRPRSTAAADPRRGRGARRTRRRRAARRVSSTPATCSRTGRSPGAAPPRRSSSS